jgi:hypothetical protein
LIVKRIICDLCGEVLMILYEYSRRWMVITNELIKEKLADLEEEYVDHLVKRFSEWEVWAKASKKVANREEVRDDEIPEVFHTELKMMQVILEMEDLGKFDWNNPRLRQLFGEVTQEPFYRFFGEMIIEISLRLADLTGVNTFLEIGAGKANLTGIMLKRMSEKNKSVPLVATDAQPVILENIGKLKDEYPEVDLETLLWNIVEPPSDELLAKVTAPTLLYERYTLNYATFKAIENIAKVADILVLGDWFNYTGQLYAYDEVFRKIGANPLFYRDVKPILDDYFPNQCIFDQRALDAIKLPNVTLLIAWK